MADLPWRDLLKQVGINPTKAIEYEEIFEQNGIDPSLIGELDIAVLSSIGITMMGDKLKIMKLQKTMKQNEPNNNPPAKEVQSPPNKVPQKESFAPKEFPPKEFPPKEFPPKEFPPQTKEPPPPYPENLSDEEPAVKQTKRTASPPSPMVKQSPSVAVKGPKPPAGPAPTKQISPPEETEEKKSRDMPRPTVSVPRNPQEPNKPKGPENNFKEELSRSMGSSGTPPSKKMAPFVVPASKQTGNGINKGPNTMATPPFKKTGTVESRPQEPLYSADGEEIFMCNKCNLEINEAAVSIKGTNFHLDCFNCGSCERVLQPNGQYLKLNDSFYHKECLSCSICFRNLAALEFYVSKGSFLCEDCNLLQIQKAEEGASYPAAIDPNSDEPWATLEAVDSELHLAGTFDVNSNEFTIGRLSTSNILINTDVVSGTHCKIIREIRPSGSMLVYLLDNSVNGTFLNGALLGKGIKVQLYHKDVISLPYTMATSLTAAAKQSFVFKMLSNKKRWKRSVQAQIFENGNEIPTSNVTPGPSMNPTTTTGGGMGRAMNSGNMNSGNMNSGNMNSGNANPGNMSGMGRSMNLGNMGGMGRAQSGMGRGQPGMGRGGMGRGM